LRLRAAFSPSDGDDGSRPRRGAPSLLPISELLHGARRALSRREGSLSFIWGYGHYFVFGGAAAVGAGLAVNVDQATRNTALTDVEAALTVTVPVAVYLITVWALHFRYKKPGLLRDIGAPIGAALVLGTSWTSEPVLATGVILTGLVAASVVLNNPR
jgi:hypothetical protein